jgi:hypothetical protein
MDKSQQFNMRTDAETMEKLDELRRVEDDIPSRGEMIRRLIHRAYVSPAGKSAAAPSSQIDIDDLPGVRQMIGTRSRKARK